MRLHAGLPRPDYPIRIGLAMGPDGGTLPRPRPSPMIREIGVAMSIESLIASWGLPAIAIGAAVEGETVVMVGGAMAHRGLIELWPAVAAAALGSFAGDQAWFLAARRFRDHPRIRRLRAGRAFARAQEVFDRHPTPFVFGFRFVAGMRTVSPIAIGATDYPAVRFAAINALSATIWALLFVGLGYGLGHGLAALFGEITPIAHLLAAMVGAVLVGFVLYRAVAALLS